MNYHNPIKLKQNKTDVCKLPYLLTICIQTNHIGHDIKITNDEYMVIHNTVQHITQTIEMSQPVVHHVSIYITSGLTALLVGNPLKILFNSSVLEVHTYIKTGIKNKKQKHRQDLQSSVREEWVGETCFRCLLMMTKISVARRLHTRYNV